MPNSIDLIVRFMDTLGHKRDAELYLKLFTSGRPESFAIIVVDSNVISSELDALMLDLSWLTKLGLFPVLVFHPPMRTQARSVASNMTEAFVAKKIKSVSIDITKASRKDILYIVQRKAIPFDIVDCDAEMNNGLVRLTQLLETRKLIFLTSRGSFVNTRSKTPVGMINLRETGRRASYRKALSQEDAALLAASRGILRESHSHLHVAITSPLTLLRELFTVKGAGTLIYMGSKINKHKSLSDIDITKLKFLLESSFEKKLSRSIRKQAVDIIYLEENYQGAAFLREINGRAYLSKFAVGLQARGLGVGRDLWQRISADFPRLFWRADPHNFISSWYAKVCDGMQKGKRWNVYWIGLKGPEVSEAIRYALSQETDFENDGR